MSTCTVKRSMIYTNMGDGTVYTLKSSLLLIVMSVSAIFFNEKSHSPSYESALYLHMSKSICIAVINT